jgi:predicted secreted hydrolase
MRAAIVSVLIVMLLACAGCERAAPARIAAGGSRAAFEPASDRLGVLRAADETGFAVAAAPRRFEFPQDHGPHPAFRHEWWYLTGQLYAADGRWFGFELTFFRLALQPPPAAGADRAGSSAWRSRQVYAAHFALTDVARGRFFSATRYDRDALGLALAQAEPFAVRVADWFVVQAPEAAPAVGPPPLLHWQLQAADTQYQLQLDLRGSQPPVLNGAQGLSRKSDEPGAASYYYSMPRLQASGRIGGPQDSVPVTGLAWLDREWGSGSLGAQQQGWDWFALDFSDGSALMFYALRDRDGRRDGHSAGTFVDASGHATPLSNAAVDIAVRRQWDSPRGGRYPAQWTVTVGSQDLHLQITPLLADQELATQPRYWEGAVQVTGRRGATPVSARGYVELVGYAQAQASATSPSASPPPTH